MKGYIEPLDPLYPIHVSTSTTDYPGLINELGYGLNSSTCAPGHYGGVFGIGVTHYVPSDMRDFYDRFNKATGAVPEFANSYVFIEAYATQAMRAVPAKSTAYAHRHLRAHL